MLVLVLLLLCVFVRRKVAPGLPCSPDAADQRAQSHPVEAFGRQKNTGVTREEQQGENREPPSPWLAEPQAGAANCENDSQPYQIRVQSRNSPNETNNRAQEQQPCIDCLVSARTLPSNGHTVAYRSSGRVR